MSEKEKEDKKEDKKEEEERKKKPRHHFFSTSDQCRNLDSGLFIEGNSPTPALGGRIAGELEVNWR